MSAVCGHCGEAMRFHRLASVRGRCPKYTQQGPLLGIEEMERRANAYPKLVEALSELLHYATDPDIQLDDSWNVVKDAREALASTREER